MNKIYFETENYNLRCSVLVLQQNEAALMQQMGHIVPAVSCKTLIPDRPHRVMKFEKVNSNFSDEQVMIATLMLDDQPAQIRVFLPSRIQASMFSDVFINAYNSSAIQDKMMLVYKGMAGKCINVEFIA